MIYLIVPQPLLKVAEARVGALGLDCRLLSYPDLARDAPFESGTYLFTSASALSPSQRALAIVAEEALLAAGPGFRVLNRPSQVSDRASMMASVGAEGLQVVERCAAAQMPGGAKYPLVLRWESAHGVAESPVLFDEAELREAVGTMVLGGFPLEDLHALHYLELNALLERSPASWALRIGDDSVLSDSLESAELRQSANAFLNASAFSQVEFMRLSFLPAGGRLVLWRIDDSPAALPEPSGEAKGWAQTRDQVRAAFGSLAIAPSGGVATVHYTRENVEAALGK